MNMNDDFLKSMQDAARLLQTAGPREATAAIQRALGSLPGQPGAGLAPATFAQKAFASATAAANATAAAAAATTANASAAANATAAATPTATARTATATAAGRPASAGSPTVEDTGHTVRRTFSGPTGTRDYLLYIPSAYADTPLPLVVMLHGCTQDGVDFAAGTGMNRLAEPGVCLVAYPIQRQSDNMSKCWNWFRPADQVRGGGEAALLAGLTQDILANYKVDRRRVYVAGLSAGGAMAAILGHAYPDLYAAVGIHSGLDVGAARDVPSALAAMKSGQAPSRNTITAKSRGPVLPTIVFQGDADTTVHPQHAEHIVRRISGPAAHTAAAHRGDAAGGRSYSKKVIPGEAGRADVEHWTIHGGGHAWAGGDRTGSYTDPMGPDASREMLRFFLAHPKVD
ncbi:alpha/beta hydrolase family esterase [Pigmentiphaga litoralis]|uniref:extracellular catalytic domain type 1 short-chain-length polyhydroxyalkanoate depolymerase n=1 Tax=Pigmentiphaga litoralis TaxID=516702 RepID=UPI003B43B543